MCIYIHISKQYQRGDTVTITQMICNVKGSDVIGGVFVCFFLFVCKINSKCLYFILSYFKSISAGGGGVTNDMQCHRKLCQWWCVFVFVVCKINSKSY